MIRIRYSGPSDIDVEGNVEELRHLRAGILLVAQQRLAPFINVPDDATAGWHSHYECYGGNEMISPDSEPIVFSLQN